MFPWWTIPEAHITPIDSTPPPPLPPPMSEDPSADPIIDQPVTTDTAAPSSSPPKANAVQDHSAAIPAPFLYPAFEDINDGSIMETYDEPSYTVNPFFLDLIQREKVERLAQPQEMTIEPAPATIPGATHAPITADDDDAGTDSPIFTPEPSPSPTVVQPTAVEEPQTPSRSSSPPAEVSVLSVEMSRLSSLPREEDNVRVAQGPSTGDSFVIFQDADDVILDSDDDSPIEATEVEEADSSPGQPMPVIPVIAKKAFQPPKPVPSGQWRVGKTPGHQGSHLRAKRKAEDDSDVEDVYTSPAKVLRKPFKPPTRIVPLAPMPRVSSAALPSPQSEKTVESSPLGSEAPSSSTSSSPTLKRSRTQRVSKPFVPLTPGSAQSRPSRQNSGPKLRRNPDMELCSTLEAQIRSLKAAVKYSSNPDEDDRVAQLVHTWRDAGREVADRLFSLLPPPTEQAAAYRSEAWGWDRNSDASMSREQAEFGVSGNVDINGNPMDRDGNPLFGDGTDDFERLLRDASTPRSGSPHGVEGSYTSQRSTWHKGAMLLQLGVDPDLLGWNESEDDWDEIDDLWTVSGLHRSREQKPS
ncbi:hypothetical protein Q8F55_007040 [Vanrija albida]|uniref:Uncharacterized protein n=1 Tax=Vanrija albida TaxID=181172 RepID=A0ABR3PZ20_9TREE